MLCIFLYRKIFMTSVHNVDRFYSMVAAHFNDYLCSLKCGILKAVCVEEMAGNILPNTKILSAVSSLHIDEIIHKVPHKS